MDEGNTRECNDLPPGGSAINNNTKKATNFETREQSERSRIPYGQFYMQPNQSQHGQIQQTVTRGDFRMAQVASFYNDDSGSRASSPGELLLCESTLDGNSSDSNAVDESRSSYQLNDTGELSSEASFHRHEKSEPYYQRNEVVVNPRSVSVLDVFSESHLLVGNDQSTVIVEPGSPESFIITENQWSRPSSVDPGSRPGSVEPRQATSPVSFPSADEVLQRSGRVTSVQRSGPTVIEVGPESLISDDEDACTVEEDNESFEDENRDGDPIKQICKSKLPPISHIAPVSRTPSPSSTSPPPRRGEEVPGAMFGGIPNITIPDSLKLLDTHIQSLHQQLIQHSMKMSVTTDAQTHLLMAQQQTHMLEAQKLLLQNQQLMITQMYGAQANAVRIIQNFAMVPQGQHRVPSNNGVKAKSKQMAYPNVMQQLLTPPLAQVPAVNYSANKSLVPNSTSAEMHQFSSPNVSSKRAPSLDGPAVKREVVSPLNPLGVVQILPERATPSPNFPSFSIKREVVTPPLKTSNSREASPIQLPPASSSLRDILARPPKVMPPDVRLREGGFRPVQPVSPFYQRPTAVVTGLPHVGSVPPQTPDGKNERRGVPMTKIRISPPGIFGTVTKTIADSFVPSLLVDPDNKLGFGKENVATSTSRLCSASPVESKTGSTVQPVKPTVTCKPPWTQSNQKAPENDDDYAVRYATTPVKRRRRRPLGMNKKPYSKVCNLCKDVFYRADDYKDHMNKVHASTFKVCISV